MNNYTNRHCCKTPGCLNLEVINGRCVRCDLAAFDYWVSVILLVIVCVAGVVYAIYGGR